MIVQLATPLRVVLLGLALVAMTLPARAQSANAVAMAREIITVKGANAVFESLVPNTVQRAKAQLLQTNPMLGAQLNEVAARLITEFSPRATGFLNDAAKIYAARFTEPELKEILAFYKTPAGKKVISLEPDIFERSMTDLQAVGNKVGEEIIARFRTEMRKKGHDL